MRIIQICFKEYKSHLKWVAFQLLYLTYPKHIAEDVSSQRILAPYQNQTGRFKGAEDAIRAFEIVRERFPNVQFVMFDIEKGKVPDWIEFHVNPSDEELRELYCSCDIFVFPSWVEGFGLPPMEAMACKCAVVTTNVGAIPDYTIPGETALVVPPRESESLAKNIIFF